MSLPLLLILWPSSVIFTAVLSFRIGVWWKGIHVPGRHEFVPRKRRRGDASAILEPEDYFEPDVNQTVEPDTEQIPLPPVKAEHARSGSVDDDTEVLPRLQDIRPPSRATPIRRPPWVG